jgi:Ca2+-binding RTX toxin-like protein
MAVINGTANSETLKGGAGNDLIYGYAGNDLLKGLGGNDTFVWNVGDGNDRVEGGAGVDTLRYVGNADAETVDIWASGARAKVSRDFSPALNLNDIERIDVRARDGADTIRIDDLSPTDVKLLAIDLAGAVPGTGDGVVDTVSRTGSAGNDTIIVARAGGKVAVTGLSAQMTIGNADSTDQLYIFGEGGNDIIDASKLPAGAMKLIVYGGAGNDRITGSKGNDTIVAETGNDIVSGGKGDDSVWLDEGNDLYLWRAGDGAHYVEAGAGFDTARLTGANTDEYLGIGAAAGHAFFYRNGVFRLEADDLERIQIRALGGADTIDIHDLADSEVQQVAVDLAATAGGTIADTKADTVWIWGTANNDIVDVRWINGQLRVTGLAADVSLAHVGTNDTVIVHGALGNDILNASTVPAGKARLQFYGDAGDDVIFGSAGKDTVVGGLGNDVAFMGAGNDRFIWDTGDGDDRVEGEAGTDTLVCNGTSSVEFFDIYENTDRLKISSLGTLLDLNDVERIQVRTLGGQDSVNVYQEELADTDLKQVAVDLGLAGGAGDGQSDQVYVQGTNGNDHITLAMAGGVVSVTGMHTQVTVAHAETLDLLTIWAASGDDVINAAGLPAGVMQLYLSGAVGNDTITGSAGKDDLTGLSGNDALRGGAGSDSLSGGSDNDYLDGGSGSDNLDGGAGDDVLLGGRGDDAFAGGLGNDTFRYTSKLDGHDVIVDFDGDAVGGQDTLNLDALFDALGIANGSRTGRVELTDNGGTVDIRVNADGNNANGFELHVATLTTADTISVGQDVVVVG